MPRFYVPHKISSTTISISDAAQLHHLKNVLRLKPGHEVTVFDMDGNEFLAIVQSLGKNQVILDIRSQNPKHLNNLKLTIACAIPKKSRMDDIIDKLTQLGVNTIIPLVTQRVVIKPDTNRENRLERWKKIALNAAQQSQRNTLPSITQIMSLQELLTLSGDYDLKLIPTLTGHSIPVREAVNVSGQPEKILTIIGPEGDFDPREIEQAVNSGFVPVSLGDTILRVETAAIAVTSYLKLAMA